MVQKLLCKKKLRNIQIAVLDFTIKYNHSIDIIFVNYFSVIYFSPSQLRLLFRFIKGKFPPYFKLFSMNFWIFLTFYFFRNIREWLCPINRRNVDGRVISQRQSPLRHLTSNWVKYLWKVSYWWVVSVEANDNYDRFILDDSLLPTIANSRRKYKFVNNQSHRCMDVSMSMSEGNTELRSNWGAMMVRLSLLYSQKIRLSTCIEGKMANIRKLLTHK